MIGRLRTPPGAGLMALMLVFGSAVSVAAKAPETFHVKLKTTEGDILVEVHREWAPHGADRFHELVRAGFYDNCAFFRVVPEFVVQFGINGKPAVQKKWDKTIEDDPVKQSNKRGMVTFAKTKEPDSRSTQVFINLKNNEHLDKLGFAPFGQVVQGMEVVDKLHSGYGDSPPVGKGPLQLLIRREGNKYLKKEFPKLDYIKQAAIHKPKDNPEDKGKKDTPGNKPETSPPNDSRDTVQRRCPHRRSVRPPCRKRKSVVLESTGGRRLIPQPVLLDWPPHLQTKHSPQRGPCPRDR